MPAKSLREIQCAQCGKSFRPANYRIKYCSLECAGIGRRKFKPTEEEIRRDEISDNVRHLNMRVDREVRNEKDLIEICGIDPKEWRILDGWECTTWELGIKNNHGKIEKKTLFRVKAKFARNLEYRYTDSLIEELIAGCRARSPKIKKIKAPETGQCLEIGAFDAHVGMLAWPEETRGPAYDVDIAVADWDNALDTLLSRAGYWSPEHVFYVLGGDICHIDSPKGETFAGTSLGDMDTRYQRVVRRINALLRRQVERIARDVSPVTVINVVGNHDRTTSFHIAEVMDAYFAGNENVEVRNEASSRAYYRWGKNLTGITHGDVKGGAAKMRDLANVMAEERPQDWAECPFREWRTGHIHQDVVYQNHSVTVRRLRALCPPNAYAAHELYLGNPRGMDGFILDKEHGLVDQPRVVIR